VNPNATSDYEITRASPFPAQWGAPSTKFNVHSIRKNFLSALYGIATAKGQIELNPTLDQLGIDDNEPSLSQEEKQARVIDLLKARSGIYHAALYESPAMRAEKPPRGSHPPRIFWYYNNWDFNALATIGEIPRSSRISRSKLRLLSKTEAGFRTGSVIGGMWGNLKESLVRSRTLGLLMRSDLSALTVESVLADSSSILSDAPKLQHQNGHRDGRH